METVEIHPQTPQERWLKQAAERLRKGQVLVFPTDTCYAVGCCMGEVQAVERIARLRGFTRRHHYTLMCANLAQAGSMARIDNVSHRLVKNLTPGPFTFVLPGTREVPRRLLDKRRRHIGVRIPSHSVPLRLLELLGEPLMSTTLWLPDAPGPVVDPLAVEKQLRGYVDMVLNGGSCGEEATTVVDLSDAEPVILREGKGFADLQALIGS